MLLDEVIFTIIDTETTGNTEKDRPIQVAAIQWNLTKGIVMEAKEWNINPQMLIHPAAMAVHHITDDMVKDKPILEDILPEIKDYVKDTILIAHNSKFDKGMLPQLNNTWLDTLRIARHLWKIGDYNEDQHDLPNHQVQTLRYWLKLNVDTQGRAAHDAIADILVTTKVFEAAINKYIEVYSDKELENFIEFAQAPISIEKMSFGKYKDQSIQEIIEKDASYFGWLLTEVKHDKMKIDDDLKLSIIYKLKTNNIDYLELIAKQENKQKNSEKKFGSWDDAAKHKRKLT